MGLFFSKCRNNDTTEQYPLEPKHPTHQSVVSYDFDSIKGQIRAVKEAEKRIGKEKRQAIKVKGKR